MTRPYGVKGLIEKEVAKRASRAFGVKVTQRMVQKSWTEYRRLRRVVEDEDQHAAHIMTWMNHILNKRLGDGAGG